jgi:hypothetical protein
LLEIGAERQRQRQRGREAKKKRQSKGARGDCLVAKVVWNLGLGLGLGLGLSTGGEEVEWREKCGVGAVLALLLPLLWALLCF